MFNTLLTLLLITTNFWLAMLDVKLVGKGYVFPEPKKFNWRPTTIDAIQCPNLRWVPPGVNSTTIELKVLTNLGYTDTVSGILCHKYTYETSCDKGFFGGESITRTISFPPITSSECESARKIKRRGIREVIPFFPSPNCVWMSVEYTTMTFVTAVEHAVHEDPYGPAFVDPIFLGGKCTDSRCDTISSNTFWLGDKHPIGSCPPVVTKTAKLYVNKREYLLSMDAYPVIHMGDTCSMTFCGVKGYVTTNRMFIAQWGKFDNSGPCVPGSVLNLITEQSMYREEQVQMDQIRMRESCFESLVQSAKSKTITSVMLSRLHPINEGPGKVYRMNNGVLEEARTVYVVADGLYYDKGLIVTIGGKNGTYDLPVRQAENGTIWNWFNGILLTENGRVLIPQIEMMKDLVRDEILVLHDLKEFPHPTILMLKNKTGLSDLILRNGKGIGTINWSVGRWLGSLGNKIVAGIGLLLGLIVMVVLGCLCFNQAFYNAVRVCCRKQRVINARAIYTAGKKGQERSWVEY